MEDRIDLEGADDSPKESKKLPEGFYFNWFTISIFLIFCGLLALLALFVEDLKVRFSNCDFYRSRFLIVIFFQKLISNCNNSALLSTDFLIGEY